MRTMWGKIKNKGYYTVELSLWMLVVMTVIFLVLCLYLAVIDQSTATAQQQETVIGERKQQTATVLLCSAYTTQHTKSVGQAKYSKVEIKTAMNVLKLLPTIKETELVYRSEMKVKEYDHRGTLLKWQYIKQIGTEITEKGKE